MKEITKSRILHIVLLVAIGIAAGGAVLYMSLLGTTGSHLSGDPR
jgi:flagellar basal body-associated protein FliL